MREHPGIIVELNHGKPVYQRWPPTLYVIAATGEPLYGFSHRTGQAIAIDECSETLRELIRSNNSPDQITGA